MGSSAARSGSVPTRGLSNAVRRNGVTAVTARPGGKWVRAGTSHRRLTPRLPEGGVWGYFVNGSHREACRQVTCREADSSSDPLTLIRHRGI